MKTRFHPHDSLFNQANALYLAHASDVAYHRAPAAAAQERLGLRAFAFRDKFTRARGFLGVCDTHAVLAFRGTDPVTLPNWLTDAVVRLVPCDEYAGRVHRGFSTVLRRAWGKVEKVLEEAQDKPLFLTGHSMGGALAVLTACRLAQMGRRPVATYTFGSPRMNRGQLSVVSCQWVSGSQLQPEADAVQERVVTADDHRKHPENARDGAANSP